LKEEKVEKKKVVKRKKAEDEFEDEIPNGCLFGNDAFNPQYEYDSEENYEVQDLGVCGFQMEEEVIEDIKEEVKEEKKKVVKKILKNPLCLFTE
jgi:hypothetical protein